MGPIRALPISARVGLLAYLAGYLCMFMMLAWPSAVVVMYCEMMNSRWGRVVTDG